MRFPRSQSNNERAIGSGGGKRATTGRWIASCILVAGLAIALVAAVAVPASARVNVFLGFGVPAYPPVYYSYPYPAYYPYPYPPTYYSPCPPYAGYAVSVYPGWARGYYPRRGHAWGRGARVWVGRHHR
jgi:hypothetical protein